MKTREKIFIYGALVILTLLFIVNTVLVLDNSSKKSTIADTKESSIKISDDTTKVVKKVSDSVVTIALYQNNQIIGNGSGSIISDVNGTVKVITNNHVVDVGNNTDIKVIFANKKEVKAKVLGKDAVSDLALLETKVDFKVNPIALGDSDKLQVGETVIAIGSPLGVEFSGTVTRGIVSGLNRTIESDSANMQVIQTDTSINPGNSGGPLINLAGQMIGINTSKINMTGFEGMGFAIPMNEARSIVEQLEKYGKVERPTLGISYQPISNISPFSFDELNIPNNLQEGIFVVEVNRGSAAQKAGIKPNDIIYSVNNKEITAINVFTTELYASKKGDKMELGVIRNGKRIKTTVTL